MRCNLVTRARIGWVRIIIRMRLFLTAVAILCARPMFAQVPTAPAALKVPEGQRLSFQAHGTGVQVYECMKKDAEYAWTLRAPDARLVDREGKTVGRHFAGPTWAANDGSSIQGQVSATVPAPDAGSVGWLLLKVVKHDGTGVFESIQSVQRLNTKGGKAPPSGCDSGHEHTTVREPYEADYFFYSGS